VIVDAMVALLIIVMTIVMSLAVADRAKQAARVSQDIRQANALLRDLLVSGPRTFQTVTGSTGPFSWTIQTQVTGADRPIEVCRRLVQMTSSVSARQYAVSTLETCPASPA
jgi:hypothetical protein